MFLKIVNKIIRCKLSAEAKYTARKNSVLQNLLSLCPFSGFTFLLYLHSRLFITLLSRITLCPNVTTVLTILLTMPVSTSTPEQSFCNVTPCQDLVTGYMLSTTRTEQFSSLALLRTLIETLRLTLKVCCTGIWR